MNNDQSASTFGVIALILAIAVIAAVCLASAQRRKQRLAYLRKKYKDERIVQLIFQRNFWQGQTSEQLVDSLGNPLAVDTKVLKTKTREVWKYNRSGANRYGLRITLEAGVVIGWDQKSG